MYITIRAFRNYGEMVPAGVIVEPTQIRRFKDKVRDGKIVEITSNNKSKYEAYVSRMLQKKFTVDTAEKYAGVCYGALETLETLETPETPEIPETPEAPETPETPETPEAPEAPETTDTAEATDTQETPATPEKPQVVTIVKPKVAATVSKEA